MATTNGNTNPNTGAQAPQAANDQPVFNIQRLYMKEMSLEQPNPPKILLEQVQPTVDIQLQLGNEKIADNSYEVTVTATVHTKVNDRTLFLAEVKEAGIFELRNIPADQVGPVLGIACPQIIYPYLRANVADVISRGGFPPVHLVEINFQAMYEAQLQQQQQQQQKGDTGTTTIASA